MSDFHILNDRNLIKIIKDPETSKEDYNKAYEVLFNRYEKQIHKMWWSLSRQFGGQGIVETLKDEYYSEAYEAFHKAVTKIDLNEIRDDNWKLVQYSSFYLRNVKTKLSKQIIKNINVRSTQNLQSLGLEEDSQENRMDRETEMAYYENEGYKNNPEYICIRRSEEKICRDALNASYSNWNDLKRKIYKGLISNKSKAEIARELGINNSRLYNNINSMKEELKKNLEIFSNKSEVI